MGSDITAVVAEPVGRVAEAADVSVLEEMQSADVAMTLWCRRLDSGLVEWLDGLAPEQFPNERFTAPRNALREAVADACASMPPGSERQALVEDIALLADRFCAASSSPQVRIRLNAIADNACRRFHQDAMAARLLCTYRGPATEWGYAERGETPAEIRQLDRGDVAILKGFQSKSGLEHNLLHRSPPIEGTGVARFLLVIDPIDWAEAADLQGAQGGVG